MNAQLRALLDLQKIDSDLLFLRDLQEKRPLELEKDRQRLRVSEDGVRSIQDRMRQLKMECDRGELDIKKNQADIDKLQVALNTAKTNQEYQILKEQIERLRGKSSQIEEAVLERLGILDRMGEERKAAESAVAAVTKELSSRQSELDSFLGELRIKADALEGQRKAKIQEVAKDALQLYEKVLSRYHDSALAMVENRVCQGCHRSVTTQAISELLMGKDLIQCRNCLRILYLPENNGGF
jgi:hypothetical protein